MHSQLTNFACLRMHLFTNFKNRICNTICTMLNQLIASLFHLEKFLHIMKRNSN